MVTQRCWSPRRSEKPSEIKIRKYSQVTRQDPATTSLKLCMKWSGSKARESSEITIILVLVQQFSLLLDCCCCLLLFYTLLTQVPSAGDYRWYFEVCLTVSDGLAERRLSAEERILFEDDDADAVGVVDCDDQEVMTTTTWNTKKADEERKC